MSISLTGSKELDKKLESLRKSVQTKVAKAAVTAGLRVLAKAIKSEIPSNQKSARKAIGFSLKKQKSGTQKGVMVGKAGAAVGMKQRTIKARAEKAAAKGKRTRAGVGISARNIHWLLAGTEERFTKKGSRTGRMKKPGIVQRAEKKSRSAVNAIVKGKLVEGIMREAAKR